MTYRADIDGLRAVAVLLVVFYHAKMGPPGGFVGVDVFFVISGFLICQVLTQQMSSNAFSFVDFCERRVRRLLPALALMTVVVAGISWLFLIPEHLRDLGGALISQPLLVANCYYWRTVKAGYFGDPAEIRPLLHTWSLGVEEQFYILFPAFLSFCLHRFRGRQIQAALAIPLVLSLALSGFITGYKPVLAFFTLPTRAWELLLGALLASIDWGGFSGRTRQALSLTGVLLLLYSALCIEGEADFPGVLVMLPALGTGLVILSGPRTWVGRMLSSRPLVLIGLVSYSLYLWHWPCIAFPDYLGYLQSLAGKFVALGASFALGFLSWYFIEGPFRRKQVFRRRRQLVVFVLAYLVVCVGVGSYYCLDGGPKRWPSLPPEPKRSFDSEVPLGREELAATTRLGKKGAEPDFLVWGDSHASSLAPVFDSLGKEFGKSGILLCRPRTPPLVSWKLRSRTPSPRVQKDWNGFAQEVIREERIRIVFLVANWSLYEPSDLPTMLPKTISEIAQSGAKPIVVLDVPHARSDPYRAFVLHQRWPWTPGIQFETSNPQQLERVLATVPKVQYIDPTPLVLAWSDWSHSPYYDADHLSDAGANSLRDLFEPFLRTN